MRLPDRTRAGDDPHPEDLSDGLDQSAWSDNLADRLTRLPPGHPSADAAGRSDRTGSEPDDVYADDLYADDLDAGDLEAGDLDAAGAGRGEVGSGGADDSATGAHARQQRGTPDSSPWGELGAPIAARSPYRPWFGADGPSDPWFATPGRVTRG
jgi:hypothetical protein